MRAKRTPHLHRPSTLLATGRDYCANTSVHGFSYLRGTPDNGADSAPHHIFWEALQFVFLSLCNFAGYPKVQL